MNRPVTNINARLRGGSLQRLQRKMRLDASANSKQLHRQLFTFFREKRGINPEVALHVAALKPHRATRQAARRGRTLSHKHPGPDWLTVLSDWLPASQTPKRNKLTAPNFPHTVRATSGFRRRCASPLIVWWLRTADVSFQTRCGGGTLVRTCTSSGPPPVDRAAAVLSRESVGCCQTPELANNNTAAASRPAPCHLFKVVTGEEHKLAMWLKGRVERTDVGCSRGSAAENSPRPVSASTATNMSWFSANKEGLCDSKGK